MTTPFLTEPALVLLGDLPQLEPDCACPTIPTRPLPAPAPGLYRRAATIHVQQLAPGWTLACNTLAGGAPAMLNRRAMDRLGEFAAPAPLDAAADRDLWQAGLLVPADQPFAPPDAQTTTLTAWLHTTNACNLDCPYCYVRKSSARMSLETGQKAIDALIVTAREHGFTTIKLKYAGGEAALHYRMIMRLHDYAIAATARAGVALRAVVLSNGTVLPTAFCDWIQSSGTHLMLSVDGVGADHDQQRPRKGGGAGAFAALEQNLRDRLLPRGIRPDICITVTGRTAHAAQYAVSWAIGYGLPFSINFYREHEQSARFADLRYEEQQIVQGIQRAYALIETRLPPYPLLDGLLDRVQAQAHGHTCGVGHSYVVITHDGRIAQCQMTMEHNQPFEATSDLIPLIASGPLHPPSVDEKEGCRDCQWRYRCAGGCPLVTLRATGRMDVKSPNCHIYQAMLPAALRLEGLRILQTHGYA